VLYYKSGVLNIQCVHAEFRIDPPESETVRPPALELQFAGRQEDHGREYGSEEKSLQGEEYRTDGISGETE
jgi:hypothetical protein